MTKFKKQWDVEMAMIVLANKNVDSKTWSEAVEWLMLYGPPHIQDILNQASLVAAKEYFPELKATGYSPEGKPLYDIDELAKALNITPEEALEKLRQKEAQQETQHLFDPENAIKVQ